MVAIGSISSWQPGRGPVTTWTASPTSRQIMARAQRDAMPPSFQQAQHLRTAGLANAAGQDVPRLIMAAWNLPGWCDVAAMTEAINAHLRRHDTYHNAFEVTGESITRRTIADPADIDFVPAALGFMEQDQIRTHVLSTTPDTLEWDCFTFGVVQKADHFTVYASVDHLHTDGTSAFVIYHDITTTYQALVNDTTATLPATAGYRDFTNRQHLQVNSLTEDSRPIKDWTDFAHDAQGDWPGFPLEVGNTTTSTAGRVVTVELLNSTETAAFDTACHSAGARLSGGVMAVAALAEKRLTGAETFRGFTPSDTRTGAQAMSAGWYASIFPITVEIADDDFGQTARAAQKSFDANKHLAAIPFTRVLELNTPEELGIELPTGPSMMLSLFDFRKAGDADAHGLGIYNDDLSRGDVNVWITRNTDQTIVAVSFPDTPEARNSVHLYLGVLREVFIDTATPTTGWVHDVA